MLIRAVSPLLSVTSCRGQHVRGGETKRVWLNVRSVCESTVLSELPGCDKELERSASWALAAGGKRKDGGEWREPMKCREGNLAFIAPPAQYSVKFWS